MGCPNVSPRIAILSFALLALVACQDTGQTSKNNTVRVPVEDGMTFVICPGDPRCGQMDEAVAPPSSCQLKRTTYSFKCGPQALPCPGSGCPTGEPGLPSQACRVSDVFIDVRCKGSASDGNFSTCSKTPSNSPACSSQATEAP